MKAVQKEFSRFADTYAQYNIIQNRVAQKLVEECKDAPQRILDLGCGSGTIAKKINWPYEKLTGADFSAEMLALHPKSEKIACRLGDFNDEKLFEALVSERYDRIFSASSLQWAEDLDKTLYQISQLNAPVSLAIFTSKTFKTLHETAGISSPLRSADEVSYLLGQYFRLETELVEYELEFESIEEIFAYIKKSGVSGGRNLLGYTQVKTLMKNYPTKSLSFEVLFARN